MSSSSTPLTPVTTVSTSSSSSSVVKPRVVILPGNGCKNVHRSNWYGWLYNELNSTKYIPHLLSEVVLENMPDPDQAKEKIWLPFVLNDLQVNQHLTHTILIGHSSGAQAILRLLENDKYKLHNDGQLLGVILVSACHTDLGCANETISGYYNREWLWSRIAQHAQWIVQYHSTDDPFIPIEEARHVAQNIKSEYIEHTKRGHYLSRTFPDLVEKLVEKLGHKKETKGETTPPEKNSSL